MKLFRIVSSVKLAVPLMIILLTAAAAGTVIESRYNAQVAAIWVYKASWFSALLSLLWVNIFCATLMRWPFKRHHTGFVITHIGLLTLLIGGITTSSLGIDGQLQVREGTVGDTVLLSQLVLNVDGTTIPIERHLSEKSLSVRSFPGLAVDRYLPFVFKESSAAGTEVKFTLKSPMFSVQESLHSEEKPEMKMGQALFRITKSKPAAQPASFKESLLIVKDAASGKTVATLPVRELSKSFKQVRELQLRVSRSFEEAVVSEGAVVDKGNRGRNPALELVLKRMGKTFRDIVFSRYPGFSLNQEPGIGLRFEYLAPQTAPEPSKDGNVIEFQIAQADPRKARLVLYKNGKTVLDQIVAPGTLVQTPWMSMSIHLDSLQHHETGSEVVHAIALPERSPLPPSAVRINGEWLAEGDEKVIRTEHVSHKVYYGRASERLPFSIRLDRFKKIDYPNTETPLSFQSHVHLNREQEERVISMNEPLKANGYTVYQSSYVVEPGQPSISIFSVNRDPGRPIKYAGSLILALGIIIFTLMRSRMKNHLKLPLGSLSIVVAVCAVAGNAGAAEFNSIAHTIDGETIARVAVQDRGRLKPFDTLARETILFLSGKYSFGELDARQSYLGLIVAQDAEKIELVEIREPALRAELGFSTERRYFSLSELEHTPLDRLARPLLAKQEQNQSLVTGHEKKIIETFHQSWMLREVISGQHFLGALRLSDSAHGPVLETANQYLTALAKQDSAEAARLSTLLMTQSRSQAMPELFSKTLSTLDLEVLYNRSQPFFWSGIFYIVLGIWLSSPLSARVRAGRWPKLLFLIPAVLQLAGFAARITITRFPPVTSMYGTMLWVAFGVSVFTLVLLFLYRNVVLTGLLFTASGVILVLADSIPLILSPDMDPIVAVLRSNLWLTIHVLTITISYAAFTIAMLLGNIALIKRIFGNKEHCDLKREAHSAYRMIQLGVFLLTIGIILGGIWADYSWGRFWGWDPKETWALIADLGFIAILHSRVVGWLRDFGLLLASTVAYLLVIMAWYGVNFILATGLHSYGFSSGGVAIVLGFVAAQLTVIGVATLVNARRIHVRPQYE